MNNVLKKAGIGGLFACVLFASAGQGQERRTLEKYMASRNPPVAEDPIRSHSSRSLREFPDGSRIVSLDLEGRLLVLAETNGVTRNVPFDYKAEAIEIAVMCAGPDGRIYGSTAHPGRLFVYDPVSDQLWFYPQEAISFKSLRTQGKYVFGGHYSGGLFWLLDTSKPISLTPAPSVPGRPLKVDAPAAGADKNPVMLRRFQPNINIPRNAFAHPNGVDIMISGQPGYGFVGGGLAIYNLEKRQFTVLTHTNLLAGYSTMAIAALPDGNLLCGTSPRGGHGTEAAHDRAELYILDWKTRKVVWNSGPLEQATSIESMVAGADGRYYAVNGDGTLVVFDVSYKPAEEGREAQVKLAVAHRADLSAHGRHTANQAMVAAPDGRIYLALTGALLRITPGTFAVEALATPPGGIQAGLGLVGGRLYFASRGHVMSLVVPATTNVAPAGIADHGAPVSAAENRGMTAAVDGQGRRVVLVWMMTGGTRNQLVLDADSGATQLIPVEPYDGDNAFSVWHSTRGYWYSAYGGHFYEFDPRARHFSFATNTPSRCAMSMHEDRQGMIWAALYPNADLIRYDPATRTLVSYGPMNRERWSQYPSYMATDSAGWVYIGIGNTRGQVIGFNPATGDRRAYVPETNRVQGVGHPFSASDGKVYATAPGWGPHELYAGEAKPIE